MKRVREGHVPINDVRPEVPPTLARVVDRLLALRPDDRFDSAVDVAESLEALLPSSVRGRLRGGARTGNTQPGAGAPSVHSDEESLDWSLIESALRPSAQPARPATRLVEREEPKAPPSRSLASHRKELEEEGGESGREVHEKYRNELIQMNRVMSELRSVDPSTDKNSDEGQTWLERLGEKVGDYLAEPSASLIIIVVLLVLVGLALALAIAVS